MENDNVIQPKQKESDYFALKQGDEKVKAIMQKWKTYRTWMENVGYARKARAQTAAYYNLNNDLERDGSLTRIKLNTFRNVVDHVCILVTQNEVDYEFQGANDDYDTIRETRKAKAYIKHLLHTKQLDQKLSTALKTCILTNEVFFHTSFNRHAGIELAADPDSGAVASSGEQQFIVKTPFDVARDHTNASETYWYIVRDKTNKHNLAMLYPKKADAILKANCKSEYTELMDLARSLNDKDDDNCYTYTFYHDKTQIMKNGAEVLICNGEILMESDLRYEEIPLVRMSASDIIDSVCGTSFVADILAPQYAMNKMASAMLSNQMNLNLTNVWSEKPINMPDITNGFRNFVGGKAAPTPFNLGVSSPGTGEMMTLMGQFMDKYSGVSDLLRGSAPQGISAASGLSLLLNQSIAFASEISRRWAALCAGVASQSIANIKFVNAPIMIGIIGKSKKGLLTEVDADSFSNIQKVFPKLSNPLADTLHGRLAEAEKMLAANQITIKQYLLIREGAPLDIIFDDALTQEDLMIQENEWLSEGILPTALISDDHAGHKASHSSLLNNPIVRRSPALLKMVNDHNAQHDALEMQLAQANAPQPPMQDPNAPPPPEGAPQGMGDETELNMGERDAGVKTPPLPAGVPPQAVKYQPS